MSAPLLGRPGISAGRATAYRNVFKRADEVMFHPGGGYIDGASRDYGNAENLFLLRPGLQMGRVSATKKWRPSFLGATQAAYTSGGTSLTLTAAQAAELVRRRGASGTFVLIGAATAGGAQTTDTVTYSAVNTTSGVVTITNIGANRVAGSLVGAGDGSEVPRTVIPDGYGIEVPSDSTDSDFPMIPIAGVIETAKLLDWPSEVTAQAYVMASLTAAGYGAKFVFDHLLNPS